MLSVFIGGIFVAALVALNKLSKSPEPWEIREEQEHYRKGREHWVQDVWLLYR